MERRDFLRAASIATVGLALPRRRQMFASEENSAGLAHF